MSVLGQKSHTETPWWVECNKYRENGCRRVMGAECTPVAIVPEHQPKDADRIVAAVNACEGISNAELDEGILKEAVDMLQQVAGGYVVIMGLLDNLMPGWRRNYTFHRTRVELVHLLERFGKEV